MAAAGVAAGMAAVGMVADKVAGMAAGALAVAGMAAGALAADKEPGALAADRVAAGIDCFNENADFSWRRTV
jgi:hypothetical protein